MVTTKLSFLEIALLRILEGVFGMNAPGGDTTDAETAQAITRPPVLFLAALVVGFLADYFLPLPYSVFGTGETPWIAGGLLILVGAAIAFTGIRNFTKAATPVQGTKPTRSLVTTGIHSWSRNPIYIGMFLIYAGMGVAARSPWILILLLPLAITIRYGVVAREETYLDRRFGDSYRTYMARVRRWL